MGLAMIAKTVELFERKKVGLSEEEKEAVLMFAYSTEDTELTEKFVDELSGKDANKQAVLSRYEALLGQQADWIRTVEALLIALERYRIEEEKASKKLLEMLEDYGIDLTVEEMKGFSKDMVREKLEKNALTKR